MNDYSRSKEYDNFIEAINTNDSIGNGHYLRIHDNKNLIIGCSPVAYCGNVCKEDLLDKYDYDIIGFGGTKDGEIIEWLQKLSYSKKYDNIIIWGSVNDIMEGAFNYSTEFSDEYKTTLKTMIEEAINHLNNPLSGKIFYVKPVYMIEGLDTNIPGKTLELRVNHYGISYYFNNLSNKVVDYIKTKDVCLIDVDFDTTSNNSDWYIHYTNPDVFISIFEKVKNHL